MNEFANFLIPGFTITVYRKGSKEATGKLLYETKNTLVLMTDKGKKMYPKRSSLLILANGARMNGSKLIGRPAERLIRKN